MPKVIPTARLIPRTHRIGWVVSARLHGGLFHGTKPKGTEANRVTFMVIVLSSLNTKCFLSYVYDTTAVFRPLYHQVALG